MKSLAVFGMAAAAAVVAGAGVLLQPAGEKQPRPAPAPAKAVPPEQEAKAFPDSWFGEWRGAAWTKNGEGAGQEFRMGLRIAGRTEVGKFEWTIEYEAGEQGKQTRAYTLLMREPGKGEWAIDENNGIVLHATMIGGVLYCPFDVGGQHLAASYRMNGAGTAIDVEITTISRSKGDATGDPKSTMPISTYKVTSVQRATLNKVKGAQ